MDFTDSDNVSTELEFEKSFLVPVNYPPGATSIQVSLTAKNAEDEAVALWNPNNLGLAIDGNNEDSLDQGEKLVLQLSLRDQQGEILTGYGFKLFQMGHSIQTEVADNALLLDGEKDGLAEISLSKDSTSTSLWNAYTVYADQVFSVLNQNTEAPFHIQSIGLTIVPLVQETIYQPSKKFIYEDFNFPSAGLIASNTGSQVFQSSLTTGHPWGGYTAGNNFIRTLGGQIAFAGAANTPGSYIYTIFPEGTDAIDLSNHESTFKIRATQVASNQKLRWLVRDESHKWFLSDETWEPTLSTTENERHMTAFPAARNDWQLVTNGDALNALGENGTALETGESSTPDLSQVSGYGIYVSQGDGINSLFISALRLSEYEPLIYYHPARASHWFEGPNNLRVGLSDMSGAAFNEMYWNTDTNIIASQNGRQAQYAFRSFHHNGRWNPTQAGYDEFYGMPTPVRTSISSLGDGPRYEWGPTPMSNWHGDGHFDFVENEDLTLGSPYNHIFGWRDRPSYTDDDFIDESDRSQADEVISDFDQGGFVEDVSSSTDQDVLAIRFNLYQNFPRLTHNTLQFNEEAIIFDTRRSPETEEPLIDENRTSADLSSVLPGAQATTATDMTEVPYRWSDRLDVLAANFRYLWNWESNSQQWTVTDLVNEEGTIPASNDSFFSIIANSPNPTDAETAQAIALYYPSWSELNQYPIQGIDRQTGEIVYQEDRLDQVVASAIQTVRGGWIGPNDEISGEFTRRQLGLNYGGILSPDHTPIDVYERLRQEFFWIFGTPTALVASIPDLEAQFMDPPEELPSRAQLRAMPDMDSLIDGSINVPTNQELTWWAAVGADKYHIYLGKDPVEIATADTNAPSYIGESTTNRIFPTNLETNTTYFWRVDSENSTGTTLGDVWRFKTSTPAFFELATLVTLNLGSGATSAAEGVSSHTAISDNILVATGAHTVELHITGSSDGSEANIRKVPSGVAANGLVVVDGNLNDLGVGESLHFDLQVKRGEQPAHSGMFQMLDFSYKGRTNNDQRDYTITDSSGTVLVEETNFDPINYDPTTPRLPFSPGEGLDFSWNRTGAGGAILSIETITLLITEVFDEEPTFTAQGTPHSYLELYYSGLDADEDYAIAELSDSDGDGLRVWEEYQFGTNPLDGTSVTRIIRAYLTDTNQLKLHWKSKLGKSYSIYRNSSLDENGWHLIDSGIESTPPENERVITLSERPRFIRISSE